MSAKEQSDARAKVVEPFLELHTGPGRSYPVFYIAEKGEAIFLMKRRTDWYKVQLFNGQEGWVYRDEVAKTLRASGYQKGWGERFYDAYIDSRLKAGWSGGQFEGDSALYLRLSYFLAGALSVEASLGRVSGDLGETNLFLGGLMVTPWKGQWLSLYGTMGGGGIRTSPARLLVNAKKDNFTSAYAGIGFSAPLFRRLFLRGDFR
ncbi:MAG: SH3 domain-containing protein, partial [Nitrospiria bacterium]